MMRWVFVFLAWLVSAAVLGALMFVAAIVLAGPHSSMLPSSIQPVVLLIAWAVFLVGPLIVARSVWRRTRLPDNPPELPRLWPARRRARPERDV